MKPDQYTISELFLDVGDKHKIYTQEWGNKDSKKLVLNIHGGPGGGTPDSHKSKYDPSLQRVIFYDQRGSGKSLPYGELTYNTTDRLLSDIDKILSHFNIKNTFISGGSWGSTLALLYAINNPSTVKGLYLDGIFTASREESDWFTLAKWRTFYPDIWQSTVDQVPDSSKTNPIDYLIKTASTKPSKKSLQALHSLSNIKSSMVKLDDILTSPNLEDFDPAPSLIELHYLNNNYFITGNYINSNAHKIKCPVYIIQGRYDMLCPPKYAYELSKRLSNSKLIWTINGHLKQHEAKTILSLLLSQSD